jgi:hypothetical protein
MKAAAVEISSSSGKKSDFMKSLSLADDIQSSARSWNPTSVYFQTSTGVKSYVQAKFVADGAIQSALGSLPGDCEGIQRFCRLNDRLEWQWGVALPMTSEIPATVPWHPIDIFTETVTKQVETKLAHERSIHPEHSLNNMKFWVNQGTSGRPGAASIGGQPQTWKDVKDIMDALQAKRLAETAAREAQRAGNAVVHTMVSESSLTAGSTTLSMPPPEPKVLSSRAAAPRVAGSRLAAGGGSSQRAGDSSAASAVSAFSALLHFRHV